MTQPTLRFVNCLDATGLHRVAYWEWAGPSADAPVAVCVHGLSRQGRDFDVLAQALSALTFVMPQALPISGSAAAAGSDGSAGIAGRLPGDG